MTEGRVYRCSWKRIGAKYRLWVTQRPKLASQGDSFPEAREALWGVICTALGDGEAILEFDSPEPVVESVARLLNPPIVTVVGNTRFEIKGDPNAPYENGLCPLCRSPRGPRTKIPLAIDSIDSGFESGFSSTPPVSFYSDDFLALLTRDERALFEWRPVVRGPRAKKVFYELIADPQVPLVGMRGLQYRPLWDCDTCGARASPSYYPGAGQDQTLREANISTFVCRDDLPKPPLNWFIIGRPHYHHLGVRQDRWQELVRERGARGVLSMPIGVLDAAEVTRDFTYVKRSVVERQAQETMKKFMKQIGQPDTGASKKQR